MEKLTEQEAISRINKKLKSLNNIEFLGFINNKWIGSRKTYIILKCKIHNKISNIGYKSFIADGWRCSECYRESRLLSPQKALENILKIHKNNKHEYEFIVPEDFNLSEGREDVIGICPIHGKFNIKYSYLIKRGSTSILCPYCNNSGERLTETKLIEKVKTLVDYINSKEEVNISFLGIEGKFCGNKTKIKLLCNKHNEVGTPIYNSFMKNGSWMCNKCRLERVKKSNTITAKEAQERVNKKFQNDSRGYDYSRVEETFTGYNEDVIVICPKHGEFKIKFRTLITNSRKDSGNCPYCLLEEKMFGIEEAREKVIKLIIDYNIKYNYNLEFIDFIESSNWPGLEKSHIRLRCNKHGVEFTTTYINLRHNSVGCPKCSKILLKSENLCYDFLVKIGINKSEIERNFYIHKVKDITKPGGIRKYIKVDFYIKSMNLIIEFDGEQHYRNVKYLQKTYSKFIDQVNRDHCLEDYCKENGITLLRIPWVDRKRIPEILKAFFEGGKDITTKVEPKLLPIPYGQDIIS